MWPNKLSIETTLHNAGSLFAWEPDAEDEEIEADTHGLAVLGERKAAASVLASDGGQHRRTGGRWLAGVGGRTGGGRPAWRKDEHELTVLDLGVGEARLE